MTPPGDATGGYCFSGQVSFDGINQAVTGDECVTDEPPGEICLDPAELTPTCVYSEDASDQTFEVWNCGDPGTTLSYTISDDVGWLECDPNSGTSTGEQSTITVHYETAALACGEYTATITISDPYATNDPQTIEVTLTVTCQPAICLDPNELTPTCNYGEDALDETFEVWNCGDPGTTLSYTISDDVGWLVCDPNSGTSGGEHDTITVHYTTAGLDVGQHTATITVSDPNAINDPQGIAVTLTVQGDPAICLDPNELTPACNHGEDAPDQTFEVWNCGTPTTTLSYTISDDVGWLECDPNGGTSTGEHDTITVHYTTAGLDVGQHTATITVSDPNAINDPQGIAVTLTVQGDPAICLDPTELTPSCAWGEDASDQTFEVWNCGDPGTTLSYTISDDVGWLVCDPNSGTSTGEHDAITVHYTTAALDVGEHTATITVRDSAASNDPQTIAVTLTVQSDPAICFDPNELAPTCNYGADAPDQTFEVWDCGPPGTTLSYTITDDADWLECNPNSGTSTGEHDTITVHYTTAGLDVGQYAATIATWPDYPVDWVQVANNGPSNRRCHAMAYDSARGVAVLFGGTQWPPNEVYFDDTWEWDGTTWSEIAVSGPSLRNNHAMAYDSARGVTVLFGGWNNVDNYAYGDTWEWDGTTWTLVDAGDPDGIDAPSPRYVHAMAYDSDRGVLVLFGGRDEAGRLGDTWEWNGSAWTLAHAGDPAGIDAPSPRDSHGMAYDDDRGVLVLYGGSGVESGYRSDTWEWDGSDWTLVATGGPGPRRGHVMAYSANRTVLFGGYDGSSQRDDTWEWDGETWTEVDVAGPSARDYAAMVYDSQRSRMVLFGGYYYDGSHHNYRDTWELGAEPQTIAVTLTVQGDPAICLDPNELTPTCIYGADALDQTFEVWDCGDPGTTLSYTISDDVGWLECDPNSGASTGEHDTITVHYTTAGLDVGQYAATIASWPDYPVDWVQVASNGPSNRRCHAMAYDSARDVAVLFGGTQWPPSHVYFADTWEWNGTTWSEIAVSGPALRNNHAMAYDSGRGVTVLFGGWNNVENYAYGDTWEWDGTTWTLVDAGDPNGVDAPSPRYVHAMAYDSDRGVVVLFGGRDEMGRLGDTWEWDGSAWTLAHAGDPAGVNAPSPRDGHGMAYDDDRGVLVLYGGAGAEPGYRSDTWEWDGSDWTLVATGGPGPRRGHAMACSTHRTVLFGGHDGTSQLDDTWEWDGETWMGIDVTGPSARDYAAMVYDSQRGRMVLFGGYYYDGSHHNYGDTWEWFDPGVGIDPQTIAVTLTVTEPTGACCLATDECQVLTRNECEAIPDATWRGPGTDCTDANENGLADICECDAGDVECDGDLDLADFASLQRCFGQSPPSSECVILDLDFDNDVDTDDFADWAERMTAPNE